MQQLLYNNPLWKSLVEVGLIKNVTALLPCVPQVTDWISMSAQLSTTLEVAWVTYMEKRCPKTNIKTLPSGQYALAR